jgi:hypothetical protein
MAHPSQGIAMTAKYARLLVVIGAAGLLTLGTLVVATAVQGRSGFGQHLTLADCGPRSPHGTVVHVTLTDRGGGMMGAGNAMMVSIDALPNAVSSGTVTFVATNTGALNHELLILPTLTDGIGTRAYGRDGKIDETSSLGEASASCGRGAGQGVDRKSTRLNSSH